MNEKKQLYSPKLRLHTKYNIQADSNKSHLKGAAIVQPHVEARSQHTENFSANIIHKPFSQIQNESRTG